MEIENSLDQSSSLTSVAEASFVEHAQEPSLPRDGAKIINLVRQRLEARLPGRIRQLEVVATDNAIVLDGQCSTYYTKQLAQHVAMAVLEYEQLVNNIDVNPTQ